MGANAQTAVPAFVSGEILTAAEMTQVNTGIPVFATTVTRDAAFGGTGEKVLAQGQYAFIEATNTTQYYDGASWQAVGASGLTYLTGATFSAVASVSLPTSTFTSTYTNYKVVFVINSADATRQVFSRMRASGTDNTNATYNNATGGGKVTENQISFMHTVKKQIDADDELLRDLAHGKALKDLSSAEASEVINKLLAVKRGVAAIVFNEDGTADIELDKETEQ
jgi:hypothetical protein